MNDWDQIEVNKVRSIVSFEGDFFLFFGVFVQNLFMFHIYSACWIKD